MCKACKTAATDLGITVVSPYTLSVGSRSKLCVAFLPDFGSCNGMVLGMIMPPSFPTDPELVGLAEVAGLFCSFLNWEVYSDYDQMTYKELLIDAGFFGSEVTRPKWLPSTHKI
jgi:hypothetical protein